MRLVGRRATLGAHAERPAPVAEKFLRESRGGFFEKSPLLRAPAASNRTNECIAGMSAWRFFLLAFSLRLRNQRKSGRGI